MDDYIDDFLPSPQIPPRIVPASDDLAAPPRPRSLMETLGDAPAPPVMRKAAPLSYESSSFTLDRGIALEPPLLPRRSVPADDFGDDSAAPPLPSRPPRATVILPAAVQMYDAVVQPQFGYGGGSSDTDAPPARPPKGANSSSSSDDGAPERPGYADVGFVRPVQRVEEVDDDEWLKEDSPPPPPQQQPPTEAYQAMSPQSLWGQRRGKGSAAAAVAPPMEPPISMYHVAPPRQEVFEPVQSPPVLLYDDISTAGLAAARAAAPPRGPHRVCVCVGGGGMTYIRTLRRPVCA